jgi:hypothetical protein
LSNVPKQLSIMSNTSGHAALCGAATHNGTPCKRPVKMGFTRCHKHGGASPEAKIKAEQAMALARMPAIEALYDVIDRFLSARCDTCGLPNADAATTRATIRACEVVLDRTGMPARAQVEVVSQSDGGFTLSQLTAEERVELNGILTDLKNFKARVKARLEMMPNDAPPMAPANTTVQ